jgi:hypothetical protein
MPASRSRPSAARTSPRTRGRSCALGTWRFSGGKDFAAVYRKGPAVIVDLVGVDFARLIVSTPDAEAVAAEIDRSSRFGQA